MRRILVSVLVGIPFIAGPGEAQAASFTPLPWQKVVRQAVCSPVACPPAVDPVFVGQRKHVGWIRDRLDFSTGAPGQRQQRPNFIDDAAEEVCFGVRPASHSPVDVVVQLNECLTPTEIRDVLSPFGLIVYSGKVVSFVLLNGVDCADLPSLAADPHVAMVELQLPVELMNDVGGRAVQSRASNTYSPNTAQDDALSGAGVNVAILDTGVDDAVHGSFAGKFVAGFDATIFEDDGLAGGTAGNGVDDSCEDGTGCDDADDEPGDGTTNPDDTNGHGTHVAGIAVGAGTTGATCRTPDDGSSPPNCAGVASGAFLVDVKVVGSGLTGTQHVQNVAEGLDWLILNASSLPGGVQVANMSLGFCPSFGIPGYADDDGTAALALQVNALAAAGVLPVVAHGNASNCSVASGTVLTVAPGSASLALTVGGTNDQGTVSRADDANYTQFLQGPRVDFLPAMTNLLALKPDIVAPGEGILSTNNDTASGYVVMSGTSMATPHVAGGAAVVLEAKPGITPGSLKALLKNTADSSLNTAAFSAVDAVWDDDFGSGMLNVWAAEQQTTESDVGFPSCTGAPGGTSEVANACDVCCSLPDYGNSIDITTATPPEEGVPNTLMAQVENAGPAAATVLVNFSVYPFAAGNKQFYDIGTQKVTIAAGDTVTVSQPWTPDDSGHNCLQVTIDYDMDTDYDNNVTQRNVEVAASTYQMRVENPFPVPARFEIRTSSNRAGWRCEVSDATFSLHPFLDCPRNVTIQFDPSRRARLGERGSCDVDVFATPEGGGARLIGGVTVETFVCDRSPGADCEGDGVPNADDNCLGRWNTLQEDRDTDGVGDACDLCADTPPGASPVSPLGCTIDQGCPCDDGGNHGQYVKCVAHEVAEMRSEGVLSRKEGDRIVSRAARSRCGK